MSATYGPCPVCGIDTMYDDRDPTPCTRCIVVARGTAKDRVAFDANETARRNGNRNERRAARKLGKD